MNLLECKKYKATLRRKQKLKKNSLISKQNVSLILVKYKVQRQKNE